MLRTALSVLILPILLIGFLVSEIWKDHKATKKHSAKKPPSKPIKDKPIIYRAKTTESQTLTPDNVMDEIQRQAAEKWPNNYVMQKYEIEKQIKAYQDIEELLKQDLLSKS